MAQNNYLRHLLKSVTISVLIAFSVAVTPLHELFFIPQMLEHFEEHSKSENLTFLEFLNLHYFSGNDHQHANNSHEHLPFKLHHFQGSTPGIFNLNVQENLFVEHLLSNNTVEFLVRNMDILDSDLVQNVFHPPRN